MQIKPEPTKDKRYYSWNQHLREQFGEKVFKVAIDGGFTCPNRDGSLAFGGCTFCSSSGSGDFAQSKVDDLTAQLNKGIAMMQRKWPRANKALAYFQNFTNTYGPLSELKAKYEAVLDHPKVVGLMIGTRPDCLPIDVLDYLGDLNQHTYLWVELGLQTAFDTTGRHFNRGYDYATYVAAVKALRERGIRVCTHIINGLPGESPDMMVETVRRLVADTQIQGVKLHLMHLMQGTAMVADYETGALKLMDQDTYIDVLCRQLALLPPSIVIHRLTGDAPRDTLIGPLWSLKKWEVLNAIDQALEQRGLMQGCDQGTPRDFPEII